MGRKILNRKEMRADFDAAERRKDEDEEEVEDELEDEDEEEDEEDEEGEEGDDEEGDGDDEDDSLDDEDAPRKKKKAKAKPKPKAKPKEKAKPRTRAAKVVRMKMVWGVFNNSNVRVAVYDYPKRKDADEHAARLTADKKSGFPFFVQPVREPIEQA